jgi:hypothetical protein
VKLRDALLGSLALALALSLGAGDAQALTVFSEDFDGYTSFPDERPKNDPVNFGVPLVSEGADEIWFGARFQEPETECPGGGVDCELAVQKKGGNGNDTPVGRFEDGAGLLFAVDTTGLVDVMLSFDWRSFVAGDHDERVVGYFVGQNPIGLDDFVDWSLFTELFRLGVDSDWSHHDFALPENSGTVWVAFWHEGGNNDYTKLDSVVVTANAVPEPAALAMPVAGMLGLTGWRRPRVR